MKYNLKDGIECEKNKWFGVHSSKIIKCIDWQFFEVPGEPCSCDTQTPWKNGICMYAHSKPVQRHYIWCPDKPLVSKKAILIFEKLENTEMRQKDLCSVNTTNTTLWHERWSGNTVDPWVFREKTKKMGKLHVALLSFLKGTYSSWNNRKTYVYHK